MGGDMIKTKELFDEAVLLPVEIRAQLVDKLLRSLHPLQKEIDELWVAEAEKRVEEIKSDKVKTIPGDEVFKKILGR
jgi:putative addiction module component (TIGR02574 family)